MSPTPAELIDRTVRAQSAALESAVDALEQRLIQAKDAHVAWEAEHGPDPDWPRWYAEHILGLRS